MLSLSRLAGISSTRRQFSFTSKASKRYSKLQKIKGENDIFPSQKTDAFLNRTKSALLNNRFNLTLNKMVADMEREMKNFVSSVDTLVLRLNNKSDLAFNYNAIASNGFVFIVKDDSILDGPKIKSPFANPNRVLRDGRPNSPPITSFSDKKEKSPNIPLQEAQKTIGEKIREFDHKLKEEEKPTTQAEPLVAASDKKEAFLNTPLQEAQKSIGERFEKIDENIERVKKETQAEPIAAATAALSKPSLWYRINQRIGYNINDNMPDDEKKRLKVARNTFFGSVFVFGSIFLGFVWFCFHYGAPSRDANGKVIHDEFSDKTFGFVYRILNSFKLWRDYVVEPSREVLLPDPIPYPYHQPKYTLVIEMKNVLVSPEWTYKTGYRFKKRPALDYFLDVVGYPNFEVVIYTSESSMTAPSVIESMDTKQRIMYKLYRDCTKYMNGHHVKDLSKLNRDLKKVIYIDFDPKSFQLNPENVLHVPKWDGDMNDTALVDLAELLKTIHLSDADDVRPTLQYYSQFDDPAKEFRRRAQYVAEQEEKKYQPQEDSGLKKYAGKLFGFRRHNSA